MTGEASWSLSLAPRAVEMAERGETSRKLGIVVVKRRVGRGVPTQRLVVMTDAVFETLVGRVQQCPKPVADAAAERGRGRLGGGPRLGAPWVKRVRCRIQFQRP